MPPTSPERWSYRKTGLAVALACLAFWGAVWLLFLALGVFRMLALLVVGFMLSAIALGAVRSFRRAPAPTPRRRRPY